MAECHGIISVPVMLFFQEGVIKMPNQLSNEQTLNVGECEGPQNSRITNYAIVQSHSGERLKNLRGKRVGLAACSNALTEEDREEIRRLDEALRSLNIDQVWSPCMFREKRGEAAPPKERAKCLMDFYRDEEIAAIFDLSGGDLANEILEELDMDCIAASGKSFWGYSDLSTVLNALWTKAGSPGVLYQIRNLVREDGKEQHRRFSAWLDGSSEELFSPSWHFLRGEEMAGALVGGNIRCFLKLAGTPWFPELKDRILFLESLGGSLATLHTCLAQLRQMGAFERINGLLIGSFTKAEQISGRAAVEETVLACTGNPLLPVASTGQVGHGADSRALPIGGYLQICRDGKRPFTKRAGN